MIYQPMRRISCHFVSFCWGTDVTSKTSEIRSQVFEIEKGDFFRGYDDLVLGRELRSWNPFQTGRDYPQVSKHILGMGHHIYLPFIGITMIHCKKELNVFTLPETNEGKPLIFFWKMIFLGGAKGNIFRGKWLILGTVTPQFEWNIFSKSFFGKSLQRWFWHAFQCWCWHPASFDLTKKMQEESGSVRKLLEMWWRLSLFYCLDSWIGWEELIEEILHDLGCINLKKSWNTCDQLLIKTPVDWVIGGIIDYTTQFYRDCHMPLYFVNIYIYIYRDPFQPTSTMNVTKVLFITAALLNSIHTCRR